MKKFFIILGIIIGAVIIAGGIGLLYLEMGYPDGGPEETIQIPTDSASIAYGKYLAWHVAGCMDCHARRDFRYAYGPAIPGTAGQGGDVFNHDLGFPGTIYSKNITSGGLVGWSNADIFHAFTTGVTKSGEPLFPVMPYTHFGQCDKKDMLDIMAYLKTLPAYNKINPVSEIDFPMNLIMRTIPQPAHFTQKPAPWDSIAYGKYLVNMASCSECHNTMDDKHQPIAGKAFAGGFPFILKGIGTVRAANITPDKNTGIGGWNEQTFVDKFKYYVSPSYHQIPWQQVGYQTIMPWIPYGGMKESDLKCIYRYLQSLTPVNNAVVKFTPENK